VTYHRDLVPLSLSSGVLDYRDMPIEHIVVDGSNIATEGRSLPSLKQLEEAVLELRRDHPNAEITVIVDATFAHRIDPSELARFEQAALRGEYVHPPAGAIGRGDAFLLRVAEKVDATVLSNDSFQEFHGEHPWLFERGRLLGGTPVPGSRMDLQPSPTSSRSSEPRSDAGDGAGEKASDQGHRRGDQGGRRTRRSSTRRQEPPQAARGAERAAGRLSPRGRRTAPGTQQRPPRSL
jgi:hypothetical protein